MTSRPARKSLAGAFQPEDPGSHRADGLSGLLPPRPAEDRRSELPGVATDGALALVPDSPTTVREPDSSRHQGGSAGSSRRSKPLETGAIESDLDLVRNVAVYLPVDLLERLRRTSRSRELTYAELVVEATAAHLDEVAVGFTREQRQTTGAGMPARPTRQRPEPGVQVQIRFDGHQVRWLDQQVERLGAPSRSALVAALLRAHLGRSQ